MDLFDVIRLYEQVRGVYISELSQLIEISKKILVLNESIVAGENMTLYVNNKYRSDYEWQLLFTFNHFQNEHICVVDISCDGDEVSLNIASSEVLCKFEKDFDNKKISYYTDRIDLLRLITEYLPQILD